MKIIWTVVILLMTVPGIIFSADFNDDFNRANGEVGNGWSSWWNNEQPSPGHIRIENNELRTEGSLGKAGGVFRQLPVTFPLQCSFDFRTASTQDECHSPPHFHNDGGWWIIFNCDSSGTPAPAYGLAALEFYQVAGSRNIVQKYLTPSGWVIVERPGALEPITDWVDFSSVFSYIDIFVNQDFSATVTITHPSLPEPITVSFPAAVNPVSSPPGDQLMLCNTNCTSGPHYFDNFTLIEVPVATPTPAPVPISSPAGMAVLLFVFSLVLAGQLTLHK